MTWIAICPHLRSESGHDAGYARAVTEALSKVSQHHWVLVPTDCAVRAPPPNWLAVLPTRRTNGVLGRLSYWSTLARAVSQSVAEMRRRDPSADIAIMMESFTIGHLASVVCALLRMRPWAVHLCLLYRTTAEIRYPLGLFHRIAFKLIERTSKFRLTLLTDSDLLKESFERSFARPVITLPIPHTAALAKADTLPHTRDELLCWWPGAPRPTKGLEKIRTLTALTSRRTGICLMVSRLAELRGSAKSHVRIVELADPLSESEYVSTMAKSNVILLPYDPGWYREATSGIFVEAVCAGKVPIVSRETWMAYELSRFGLDQLAVDWSRKDLLDEFYSLVESPTVSSRLNDMRDHYLAYHNPQNYGCVLEKIAFPRKGA